MRAVGYPPISGEVHVRAPGKINLALGVGGRRPDGFHPLATLFLAVSLYEDVAVSRADEPGITVTGPHAAGVPTDGTNLALRAALLLAERVGIDPEVHLTVHKGVPVAGGMAGGSADAAAALVACDALWGTHLSPGELAELGAELGSDVPFALHGHAATGRGRGEQLAPALVRGELHWALGLRHTGLATPDVFAQFDLQPGFRPAPRIPDALLLALSAGDTNAVGRALSNDLQDAAFALAPDLEETCAVAAAVGALGVVVSGSGPTVAALAADAAHARTIAAALTSAGVVETLCAAGPVPGARVVRQR